MDDFLHEQTQHGYSPSLLLSKWHGSDQLEDKNAIIIIEVSIKISPHGHSSN